MDSNHSRPKRDTNTQDRARRSFGRLLVLSRAWIIRSRSADPSSRALYSRAPKKFAGVIQTGRVARALYGGFPYGHTAGHVAMSIRLKQGELEFASDWPRWAVVAVKEMKTSSYKKPEPKWTFFDLTLGQPPEPQRD